MADVMFYHLEQQTLEQVLPKLLEKTLERGWTAVVQAGSQQRVDALNDTLWTYSDISFLPHGRAQDGDAALQPVFLTHTDETPNAARIRFIVDGASIDAFADPASFNDLERVVFIFDGGDEQAVAGARRDWKAAKTAGHALTYWQQDPNGRWTKRA